MQRREGTSGVVGTSGRTIPQQPEREADRPAENPEKDTQRPGTGRAGPRALGFD